MVTESDIQAEIVKELRARGWFVLVTSSKRSMPKQMRGLPDVLAWRVGYFVMIECKSSSGSRRDSQVEFWLKILPHLGAHVVYIGPARSWFEIEADLRQRGILGEKA